VLILQVGFNKGDGVLGYLHPFSLLPIVLNMSDHSNVGVSGRWMYRVDGNTAQPDSCVPSSGTFRNQLPQVSYARIFFSDLIVNCCLTAHQRKIGYLFSAIIS